MVPAPQAGNPSPAAAAFTETRTGHAYFLPQDVSISGALDPSVLHRGIYRAVVYHGALRLEGHFSKPSFAEWKIGADDILWDDAVVALAISDLRGAKETVTLTWDGRAVTMAPGSRLAFDSSIHARLGPQAWAGTNAAFSLTLSLNGSSGIRFAPAGQQTRVTLSSSWTDPSFAGAFLPTERHVTAAGFEAAWQVSYYGRSFPQQWLGQDGGEPFSAKAVQGSLFGVDLIEVVDAYRLVERSIKYGILFIVLIFTAFFLYEILAPLRVHPLQYILVGMALCLFYLALLSLSEIVRFGAAYFWGAAASTLLITLYSAAVLRGARRAALIGLELAMIYAFLFVVLRLQDLSLLVGTAGLFLALALVMYLTRKIDWYARDSEA
jgi:inner membrane protein